MINKRRPQVSVIIPAYNAEEFIEETILSVLKQTYQNFEIIVIDDASEDSTRSIVKKLSSKEKRIKLYEIPHVGKPAVLRNIGVQKSEGEFIAFLDSDDIWQKEKLEEQIKLLKTDPLLSLVYSASKTFGEVHLFSSKYEILPLPFKAAITKKDLIMKGNSVTCSTVIAKKELLLKTGGFDESNSLAFVEDYDLWIKLSDYGPLGFIPRIHTFYRIHPTQSSKTWEKKKERLEKLSSKKNLDLAQYKYYRNKGIIFLFARNFIHLLSNLYYVTIGKLLLKRLLKQNTKAD